MNHKRHDLLPIGTFAEASLLSQKALRLYDELNILKPAFTDPESGYRYYEVSQLETARLIRMMRQMDMPLVTIRRVLAATPAEAELLVREHWQGMQLRLEQARRTVHDLISALKKEKPNMAFEVQVKNVGAQPVISITSHVKIDGLGAVIQDSLAKLQSSATAKKAKVSGPPIGIFHGAINADADGPIEICLPTEQIVSGVEGVESRELPAAKVAWVMMAGQECTFPAILKGYDAIVDWIKRNGYEIAASPREIWHTGLGDDARMDIEWPFRE